MRKTLIGIGTYLYEFDLSEEDKYRETLDRELRKGGTVSLRFINNKYAFEVTRKKINS